MSKKHHKPEEIVAKLRQVDVMVSQGQPVSIDVPWRKELVRETLRFEDGDILIPTAPGLGVKLIEEACAKFPYEPTNVPLFDGSMNTSSVATGRQTFGQEREG